MEQDQNNHKLIEQWYAVFQSQQSLLDKIARYPFDDTLHVDDRVYMTIGETSLTAHATIERLGDSIASSIVDINPTDLLQQPPFEVPLQPYQFTEPSRQLKIWPLEPPVLWVAVGTVNFFNLNYNTKVPLKCRIETLAEQLRNGKLGATRFVYRGADVGIGNYRTFYQSEDHFHADYDSYDCRLFGTRSRIRQYRKGPPQESEIVFVIGEGEIDIRSDFADQLWLLLSFIAGNRPSHVATEYFNVDGDLMTRVRHGDTASFSVSRNWPINLDSNPNAWKSDVIGEMSKNLALRMSEGYPLHAALYHLNDSNTEYLEGALKNLLLTLHTLFEFWSDLADKRTIIGAGRFSKLVGPLREAVKAQFSAEGEEIIDVVETRLNTSNARFAKSLQDMFFQYLGINPTPLERDALNLRNKLFHRGYVTPIDDWKRKEIVAKRYRETSALRTLVNKVILRLLSYEGMTIDYLGHNDIPV